MHFNSPESCFIQPYSCRPVDAAPTDYPWNPGITGYFPSPYRRTLNTCTHTYTAMGTRTISISDDAYERLSRLKGPSNMSFSEVILKYTPQKKKLSEILKEFGPNPALASSIEEASREMRKASMREVDFDADA